MTMADSMQMIVVLVSEGRSFPRRKSYELVFEARFDGELLTTDGVTHSENPEITQELAWQISKKSLQQHKLQRTPIKILCYAVDTRSSVKEQIGYIILDLRSAPEKPVKKWYQVLNTKYKKSKPHLKVALYLEPLSDPAWNDQMSKISDRSRGNDVSLIDISQLKPELNDTDGVFQLGPVDRCKDIYVMSVTVAFASNLTSLLPNSNRNITIDNEGFYFFYTLLNNEVITEKFLDILDPNLTAERVSIRISTSLSVLRHYLTTLPALQVHLCTGNTSLGHAEISLSSLLTQVDELINPSLMEGAFQLHAPARAKMDDHRSPAANEEKPVVGVSINLRRETPPTVQAAAVDSGACVTEPNKQVGHSADPKSNQKTADTDDDYSNTFETEQSSTHSPPPKTHKRERSAGQDKKILSPNKRAASPSSLSVTTEHTQNSSVQPHHYEFTLQLKTISNINTDHHISIYLRYRYTEFGSAAPFTTHPAIEVRRDCEYKLSNSLCTMDFSMSMTALKNTISQKPFEVELWQYDTMAGNKLLGSAVIPLAELFTSNYTNIQLHGKQAAQLNKTLSVPVRDRDSSHIAVLTSHLSLSDFGEVPANLVVERQTTSQSNSTDHVVRGPSSPPDHTAEYKAALELELWKDAQETLFEKQWKEKEVRLIAKLTDDYKRRDMDREILCKKKISENNNMQQELQKMINQLNKREKSIAKKEHELSLAEAEQKHSYDRKLLDLKEGSRRLEQECEHRLNLARSRNSDYEQQVTLLKQKLDEAAVKYTGLEREFSHYKQQQHDKPEVKLQSEINLLTLEKVELERRLESCNKSKAHYKQQWGRALKENAKLKDASDEEAKSFAQRQIQELELLKQRLFAAEEREIIKSEKTQLADIKEELSRQQKEKQREDNQEDNSPLPSSPHKSRPVTVPVNQALVNPALEEQLRRLQSERDNLLRTGVFNTDDEMILELERRIRAIIHSMDNTTDGGLV